MRDPLADLPGERHRRADDEVAVELHPGVGLGVGEGDDLIADLRCLVELRAQHVEVCEPTKDRIVLALGTLALLIQLECVRVGVDDLGREPAGHDECPRQRQAECDLLADDAGVGVVRARTASMSVASSTVSWYQPRGLVEGQEAAGEVAQPSQIRLREPVTPCDAKVPDLGLRRGERPLLVAARSGRP